MPFASAEAIQHLFKWADNKFIWLCKLLCKFHLSSTSIEFSLPCRCVYEIHLVSGQWWCCALISVQTRLLSEPRSKSKLGDNLGGRPDFGHWFAVVALFEFVCASNGHHLQQNQSKHFLFNLHSVSWKSKNVSPSYAIINERNINKAIHCICKLNQNQMHMI